MHFFQSIIKQTSDLRSNIQENKPKHTKTKEKLENEKDIDFNLANKEIERDQTEDRIQCL